MKNIEPDNEPLEGRMHEDAADECEIVVRRAKIGSSRSSRRPTIVSKPTRSSEKEAVEKESEGSSDRRESYRLTDSQGKATESLIDLMSYFFDPEEIGNHSGNLIPTNCNALLLGPTGCGKTIVVGRAAESIGAKFLNSSLGSWVPLGGVESAGSPTLVSVVEAVCQHKKVVFFFDELDKLFQDSASLGDWGRNTRNDVMMLFGRDLNVDQLKNAASYHIRGKLSKKLDEIGAKEIERFLRERLFLAAAGTWQKHQKSSAIYQEKRGPVGFSAGNASDDSSSTPIDKVIDSGELPEELLRRFYPDYISLEYPSEENLREIIESDHELTEAIRKMNISIDYKGLLEKMGRIGMMAISGYKTSTMLQYRKWRKRRSTSM